MKTIKDIGLSFNNGLKDNKVTCAGFIVKIKPYSSCIGGV